MNNLLFSQENCREKTRPPGEEGAIWIESCIAIIFLCAVTFSTVEFFFIADSYMTLSQTVREAAYAGISSQGHLGREENLNPDVDLYNGCMANTSTSTQCAHVIVHWRVRRLVETHVPRIIPSSLNIISSFDVGTGYFTVKVDMRYKPLFSKLGTVPLRHTVSSKMLSGG